MIPTHTIPDLYDQFGVELELKWDGGGNTRLVTDDDQMKPMVGPFNMIRPNRIQIIGPPEHKHIKSLGEPGYQNCLKSLLHGVFMEVLGKGVLLSGLPAAGKSELALELVSRGHRLVADDATEFTRLDKQTPNGRCPPVLQDFLEVRGLGILNIRAMFGNSAVKPSKVLSFLLPSGLINAAGVFRSCLSAVVAVGFRQ